ncbi:MAG: hypothetical protein M0R80_02930 [Proteobacteria bacterium]|jgi:hypothetical protein|nr:hypothetical protein [Pseudomonadota bacterium]
MLIINFNNVENLVFYNEKVQALLPEFIHLFNSWKFAVKNPSFRSLGKRSIADFLNHLTEDNIEVLTKYFGDKIQIDRIDYHIVKNSEYSVDTTEVLQDAFSNIVLFRKNNHLYVSSWR